VISRPGSRRERLAYPVSGPALHPQAACDGKMARGALRADGTCLFLLSAAAAGPVSALAGAVVAAGREIPPKRARFRRYPPCWGN
jgi:hypothetical protein